MMNRAVVLAAVFVAVLGRPLEWFAEEKATAVQQNKDMSFATRRHNYEASEPTSFLQTTTGGHPLECDCERVKCNCVKRCECQLPTAQQNHVASSFLEIVGDQPGASAPLYVDIDSSECFLETGESLGQDQHHMLDCECDKVKCNCVKHCECSLPSSAAGASTGVQAMAQVDEGAAQPEAEAAATENLLQEEEGLQTEKAFKKDEEEDDQQEAEENGASTESFMKDAGMPDGPAEEAPKPRSKMSSAEKKKVEQVGSAPTDAEGKDAYAAEGYNYQYGAKDSGYAYNYGYEASGAEEKSDYEYSSNE